MELFTTLLIVLKNSDFFNVWPLLRGVEKPLFSGCKKAEILVIFSIVFFFLVFEV